MLLDENLNLWICIKSTNNDKYAHKNEKKIFVNLLISILLLDLFNYFSTQICLAFYSAFMIMQSLSGIFSPDIVVSSSGNFHLVFLFIFETLHLIIHYKYIFIQVLEHVYNSSINILAQ